MNIIHPSVQARRFSLFGHTVRVPDETDLNSFPIRELEDQEETTGMRSHYVDEDYPARPEIQKPLPE